MKKNAKKNKGSSKFLAQEHLDKIGEIPIYYGFAPAESFHVTKADIDMAENADGGEKVALMRAYQERGWFSLPQPVMLYFKNVKRRYCELEILGASGSIAEAVLIQTAKVMLAEEGHKDIVVEVNSIGNKDSTTRFVRELTAYYRKHINDMTPVCRESFKRDPFDLLSSRDPDCRKLNAQAPRAMDFLVESSRRHLEEILEYFETLEIPYVINNFLVGKRAYCTETVFTIVDKDQRVLATGARYNGLGKKFGLKRDMPGAGISLFIKSGAKTRAPLKKTKRPIASFVQLGMESKLLSLDVIERLRQAKIPLYLSLAKDRLGAQVSSVEKYQTPYVIVIGKKEAMDRTAIVRDNDTHAQDVVPLADLPKYMKKKEVEYWKRK